MTEARLERLLLAGVRRAGGVAWRNDPRGATGAPDRVVCVGGDVAMVELKAWRAVPARGRPSGLTPDQRARLLEWHRAGGAAILVIAIGTRVHWLPAHRVPPTREPLTVRDLEARAVAVTTTRDVLGDWHALVRAASPGRHRTPEDEGGTA